MYKKPNPIDIHVGNRVRQRRMLMGVSQQELGRKLGVTFQQVQKYEKGINRLGASRLFMVAQILNVPVAYFFEGVENKITASSDSADADMIDTFTYSVEGQKLLKTFAQITSSEIRHRLMQLMQTIAQSDELAGVGGGVKKSASTKRRARVKQEA